VKREGPVLYWQPCCWTHYPDLSESIQTLIYGLFKIYLNTVFLFLRRSCTGYKPFLTSYSCALALLSPHPVILSPALHCCFRCTITLWTKWQTLHCFLIVLQLQLLNCVIYECLKCVYWEFKLFYSSLQSLPVLMWKKSPPFAYTVCVHGFYMS